MESLMAGSKDIEATREPLFRILKHASLSMSKKDI
jgi:hypothetical protein